MVVTSTACGGAIMTQNNRGQGFTAAKLTTAERKAAWTMRISRHRDTLPLTQQASSAATGSVCMEYDTDLVVG